MSSYSNIKVRITLTREKPQGWHGYTGRINTEMILKEVEDLPANLYYLCGPPAFVDDMKDILQSLGVDRSQIKTERYD